MNETNDIVQTTGEDHNQLGGLPRTGESGAAAGTLRIGTRLRHARMAHGYRMKDVAQRAECSESLVSKIETNKLQPSLKVLHRICAVLDLTIGDLFSQNGDDEKIVWRQGERPIVEFDSLRRGVGIRMERLAPTGPGRLLQGSIHLVAPQGSGEGLITHAGEEIGYVLEGTIKMTVGTQTYTLHAGDSLSFRSELPHGYRNDGDTEARILFVNTPPSF